MGWDVKATVDAAGEVLAQAPELPSASTILDRLAALPEALPQPIWGVIAVSALSMAFLGLTNTGRRIRSAMSEAMLSNWRLAVLGATGIVLSFASGYTTWDGMKNFTGEPVLSLMITFGIQGLMLVIAWLIGESFATGMNQSAASGGRGLARGTQAGLGALIGAMLFVGLAVLVLQSMGYLDLRSAADGVVDWSKLADSLLVIVVGLLAIALMALYSGSDLVKPYVQSSRVIVKNAILWVMFLACATTSILFSFDSRFSAIFPMSERIRAAELRAQNQVAGILGDIGSTIEARRQTAAMDLFASEGWNTYDATLGKLAREAQASAAEIENYFNEQIESRNIAIKEQQERIATSQSGQAGLTVKKTTLTDELARLEGDRPTLAEEYGKAKADLDNRAKEIDSKRVEAMAEDKGVEGTGNTGKGPVWRQRMGELGKLKDYYKVGEERVNDAKKRLDATEGRISQVKRELATVDGELAKYKGEEATAGERIKLTEQALAGEKEQTRIDPARVLPAFEASRNAFRQEPTTERLADVQKQCSQIFNAMFSAEVTKPKVRELDCDPKAASEAASVLFALNAGAQMFNKDCAGGDKLAQHTTADALFGFSRKCLADSGLPSKETDALRTKINFIELTRDDKAHHFVVSWNAFQDGNRLAYLALAIAIAIDSLIFMSGLFAANAVRSPLSDVPSVKARTAQQLEDIIENALLPDTFETARATLQAMRPITNAAGFMAEVRPDRLDSHTAEKVLGVLNAGSTIHAVEFDESRGRYLVRAELFEFLSTTAKKAFEANDSHATLADLEKTVAVALLPDVGGNSETVLSYMHPISEDRGFTAEIKLGEVETTGGALHLRTVRNLLNAGATHDRVQRVGNDAAHYYVHKDLYKTLARIRGRTIGLGYGAPRLEGPAAARAPSFGGSLNAPRTALADHTKSPPPLTRDAGSLAYLHEEFRSAMLKAMGLDEAAFALVSRPEFVGEAIAAGKSLEQVKEANAVLGHQLRWRDKEMRDGLRLAYNELWSRQGDDEQRIDVLNAAYNEIEHVLPALMLAPRGPYERVLWQLVNELESAAGPDDGLDDAQQQLLDRLRGHAAAIAMIKRDSPESWKKAGQLVFAWDDGSQGAHATNA
ncbi:MAG: hypothetical protein ACT4N2_06795 [Hyphomicrobium sp.]